jgi:hypothetical protein
MGPRRTVAAACAAFVVGVAACGSSGSTATPSNTSTTSKATTTTSTSQAATGRPTQWRDDTAHWTQLAPQPFDEGPQAVADDLAALYRGGDTSEVGDVSVEAVRTGEPLVVVLGEVGVSDAVLGRDIEITLEGGDQGWAVVSARVRDLCMQVDESNPTQCG